MSIEQFLKNEVYGRVTLLVRDLINSEDEQFTEFSYHHVTNLGDAEIYEWWMVTEYMADKLIEAGAPVLSTQYGEFWGRTTTGQHMKIDSIIQEITP